MLYQAQHSLQDYASVLVTLCTNLPEICMVAPSLQEPTSSVFLTAYSMQTEEIPCTIWRAHGRCANDRGLLQRSSTSCITGVAVIRLQSYKLRFRSNTVIPLLKRRVVSPYITEC